MSGIAMRLAQYLLVAAMFMSAGLASAAEGELFLTNAHIVDPVNHEVRTGNLLIRDGIILTAPDQMPQDYTGRTVDLQGQWVIPGLNDMHAHTYGNGMPGEGSDTPGPAIILQRQLYAGVTGILDLFNDEDTLYAVREQQRADEIVGADLFASLSCLTATEGHCSEYGVPTRVMDSPADARRVVTDLALRQPDVIKIVYQPTDDQPSIDLETLTAAVATASEHDIRTIIHVKTWQDVRDAVTAGASAVTHVPRGPIPDDVALLMVENSVAAIPTLTVETELVEFIFNPAVLDTVLAQLLSPPDLIAAYRADGMVQQYSNRREELEQRNIVTLASVGAMADAGVTILAGTDAGNWGTIHGYSLHRELVKLVAAGLTPWQALAASTTDAGAFLGRSLGVRPGDEANLVVLEASPIENIRNTQRISMVIHHGTIVDRDALLIPGSAGSEAPTE